MLAELRERNAGTGSECRQFLHTMDRPGHENARAFYCEAWNGTGAYTYDRIDRAAFLRRRPRDQDHGIGLPAGSGGDRWRVTGVFT
jgi:hypothetical protein